MFRKTSLGFWLIFCHFYILNVNSLECIRDVFTLFWTGYQINYSFSQEMYGSMTLCGNKS